MRKSVTAMPVGAVAEGARVFLGAVELAACATILRGRLPALTHIAAGPGNRSSGGEVPFARGGESRGAR